jgi:hypothetical protein
MGSRGSAPGGGLGAKLPEAERFLPYYVMILTLNLNTKSEIQFDNSVRL